MKYYLLFGHVEYENDFVVGMVTNEELASRWVEQQTKWREEAFSRRMADLPDPIGYLIGADSYTYEEIEVNDAEIEKILVGESLATTTTD